MHWSGCVVYSDEFKLRVNVRDYPTASNGLAPIERTIGKLHFRQKATLAFRRDRTGGVRD